MNGPTRTWLDKARRRLLGPSRPKVFCIGYNKTGTTTLATVLMDLGYRLPVQSTQERLVVEEAFRGNYRPLADLCRKYDAFQDLPFSQGVTYAVVDCLFPGSKFILSVRDAHEWFESLTRFHLSGILKKAGIQRLEEFGEETFKDKAIYLHTNYMYNVVRRHAITVVENVAHCDWSLVYDRNHRIQDYVTRNQQIIEYFQGREDQLLVLDVTKEEDTSKIVDFLGFPREKVSRMPHLNRSLSPAAVPALRAGE